MPNALSMPVKFRSFLLILALILTVATPVHAAEESDDALQKIQNKLEHTKRKIQEKTHEKKIAEEELGEMAQQLRFTEINLKKAKKNLTVTQKKAEVSQGRMRQTQEKFSSRKVQFSKRVVEIYKNKNMGALEFIFAPTNMMSMLDMSYYFDKLMTQDTTMIQSIKTDYRQLATETQKLETQKKSLAQINQEISMRETFLTQKKKQQQRYVQTLHAEIAEMERMTRELEQASQEITNKIRGMGKSTEYLGTGRFAKPVSGWLSSLFGYRLHPIFKRRIFHNGIDFAAGTGAPIYAADSGTVIVAGEGGAYRGYGRITIIDHGTNKSGHRIATVYAHQSRMAVREGQRVNRGDLIGYVGSTGNATGPHLHFEVRSDGIPVNPLSFLRL